MTPAPILLYDGTCGFCARSVQFLLSREPANATLRFAPLEGRTGRDVQRRFPALARVNSVVWYDPGTNAVLVRSDAAIAALRTLGPIWRVLARLVVLVPRPVRNAGYDAVARIRHRLAGRGTDCLVPTAAQRARFLD